MQADEPYNHNIIAANHCKLPSHMYAIRHWTYRLLENFRHRQVWPGLAEVRAGRYRPQVMPPAAATCRLFSVFLLRSAVAQLGLLQLAKHATKTC